MSFLDDGKWRLGCPFLYNYKSRLHLSFLMVDYAVVVINYIDIKKYVSKRSIMSRVPRNIRIDWSYIRKIIATATYRLP